MPALAAPPRRDLAPRGGRQARPVSLVVVTAPTAEPLTVEEVQSWCKATESAEAEIIESLTSEARRAVDARAATAF